MGCRLPRGSVFHRAVAERDDDAQPRSAIAGVADREHTPEGLHTITEAGETASHGEVGLDPAVVLDHNLDSQQRQRL